MSEWQPIETAPRDCATVIDLWCVGLDGEGWLKRGTLYPSEPDWLKTEDGGDYFPHENGGWFSHWQHSPVGPPADAPAARANPRPASEQAAA